MIKHRALDALADGQDTAGDLRAEEAFDGAHLTGLLLQECDELFRRRLGPDGKGAASAEEVATAFLALVVGGVASNAAWGMIMPQQAIDRHTAYSVRLFLYGLLPAGDSAAEEENRRLKKLLADTAEVLAQASR